MSQGNKMTGGDAIVQSLIRNGVDTLFGIPGVQTYGLFDALQRNQKRIRVITPRHEQTTAYMAMGYAKSTGRIGAFSVVPGPGILNTTAALCTAYGASAPVLGITGQVPSEYIGKGMGHLHELPDQLATLRTLTKWSARIEHTSQVPEVMHSAFRQLQSGRPRPVVVEMPWEIFTATAPVTPIEPPAVYPQPEIDLDLIVQAAALLKKAHNPLIMVGSGAQHAAPEVQALAEQLQAPVVSWRGGRGIVSDEHPLGLTCAAGFKRWAETDVVIGIGSRLEMMWFRWPDLGRQRQLINIDIDPVQMVRLKPAVGIVGDAARASRGLLEEIRRHEGARPSRTEEFLAVKTRTHAEIQKITPHVQYLDAIRKVLPRDGFFVEEICQAGFTSFYGFPVYQPRTYVTAGHQGTLGYGFPTALGVKVGNPDKCVVSITGDGGFLFGLQDLITAAQYRINLVVVVFNNSAYGNVYRDQQRLFERRTIGSELSNPDFIKLAESFGIAGERVHAPAQLAQALERAFAADAPALIEVPIDKDQETPPWEFLMPTPSV
ncbi:thiamine pyrophosphate-dependent enzyme [Castellaniella sp.]|uniref:thiamine pyrophosphate-dependent enzyme n=1 Tax=Castellaniella sp. TaxID=1955812 RepID=UPI002AFFC91E|nr:thiamine pyrophosphate-dependent enzyme [Castellaniella sp.]